MMKTNAHLQKGVMEGLKSEPCVPSTQIGVAVKNGDAPLSGTFPRLAERTVVRSQHRKRAHQGARLLRPQRSPGVSRQQVHRGAS